MWKRFHCLLDVMEIDHGAWNIAPSVWRGYVRSASKAMAQEIDEPVMSPTIQRFWNINFYMGWEDLKLLLYVIENGFPTSSMAATLVL